MIARPVLTLVLLGVAAGPVAAAQIGPPLFDVTRQCDANSHRNVRAMSECVVAESEARAGLLQNWSRYSDSNAEKCIAVGRKEKRLPYTAMAKCMSVQTALTKPPQDVGKR